MLFFLKNENCPKKLNIAGGIFLLIGLFFALLANNYIANANNFLADRVAVKDMDSQSHSTMQIKSNIKTANAISYIGTGFTLFGIILQIVGTAVTRNKS